MTPTRLYNFRIDDDLDAALKALKARDGVPESEAIRRALREYLTDRSVLGAATKGAGMSTNFSALWLVKGHFDLFQQPTHSTTTLQIKEHLNGKLGLSKNALRVALYPTGAQKKHTYWWRETDLKYGECQFIAQISQLHPVLSLGAAIEKGRETGQSGDEEMDRSVWDWGRFIDQIPQVLSEDIPAVADDLEGPINVHVSNSVVGESKTWKTRAFSYVGNQWFERHAGNALVSADTIAEHLSDLDGRKDTWGIVHFVRDLGVREVDGMSPETAASTLYQFNAIRRRVRPETPTRQ